MAKIEPFEKFSEEYDAWFEKNKEKYEAELRAIEYFIPKTRNGLEVGVGSGKFAAPLGIKTGVEPSPKMAQKTKALGISVCLGLSERLPFPESCFDFVLMVTTICFVDDLEKSFQEAFRVLKKEGFIVIGFIDKNSELGRKYIRDKNKSKFYKIAHFFSTPDVLRVLTNTGFGHFQFKQTLFPGNDIYSIENGYGKGSFVAIKSLKTK